MKTETIMANIVFIVLLIFAIPYVADTLTAMAADPSASAIVLFAHSFMPLIMVVAVVADVSVFIYLAFQD